MNLSHKLAAACGGVVALAVMFAAIHSGEPSHDGRTLSEWLSTIETDDDQYNLESPAAKAVQAMGSDALPFLVRRIAARESALEEKYHGILSSLGLREEQGFSDYLARLSLQSEAVAGFRFLGAEAHSAIPELKELMDDPNDSGMAAFALAAIGVEGVDVLLDRLESPNARIRRVALLGLGSKQVNDDRNVSKLIEFTDDPDLGGTAMLMLTSTQGEPEVILPVLTNALVSGDNDRQLMAISSLRLYGTNALPAVPVLRSIANTVQADKVRTDLIQMALTRIDPEGVFAPAHD